MAQQRIVASRTAASSQREEEEDEEKQETRAFLFEYVSRRAQRDSELQDKDEELECIKQQGRQIRSKGPDAALDVAARLAEMGDEIDAQYQEEMKEIIELTGSPETAFAMFSDIVRNLFEWDSQGGAKISLGRVAALLAYCYHLIRTYITEKMASSGLIISFMGLVATWLFNFLIKAKFYEWLHNQGGWGQLVLSLTSGASNWGRNIYLFVGIASLTIWALSYFRGT